MWIRCFSSAPEQVEEDEDYVEVNEEGSRDVLIWVHTFIHRPLHIHHQEQSEDQRPQRPVRHLGHVVVIKGGEDPEHDQVHTEDQENAIAQRKVPASLRE